MGQYIHYTQEEKERANSVNLEQLLLKQGERLLPAGREKRLGSNHSVTIHKNYWYDHAEEKGGLAIDFVKMYGFFVGRRRRHTCRERRMGGRNAAKRSIENACSQFKQTQALWIFGEVSKDCSGDCKLLCTEKFVV